MSPKRCDTTQNTPLGIFDDFPPVSFDDSLATLVRVTMCLTFALPTVKHSSIKEI